MAKYKNIVFISHSGADTWVARQIADKVTSCGAQPFLDEADVDVGTEFEEEIRNMLGKASEFLVLFTPWAFERPYIWVEIGVSWYRRIPIVVLLYGLTKEEFLSNPKTPSFLKRRDMISINNIDKYLDQLQQRISNVKRKDKK
ncbi:TiR protein [Candidatus Magnetobacterium bavaricum]|uniref:TiR protein n=1 Tax=Candidatus Magnetobacterium bavaricum TaxID=29290 RepID=A0A0F3GV88_9BACT|nr:TiR protein [Candidatus Magnetobacterium bavaricum]